MPKLSIFKTLRALKRDQEGVALVEMAMSIPLLMLLCLGMIDISRLVAAKIDLEQAAQRTTDFVLAKRPTDGRTTKYTAEAAEAAGVGTDKVTVTFFLECDGVRADKVTDECLDTETTARFAYVSIADAVQTDFNWSKMASFFDGKERSSTVRVVGDSTVRYQ
ncbi:TadE/TadG family type IV pilus assembly protein [Altererythrobacter sp. MF3-039]|uniref:TadE/TadG family type IV pilus assembly protein n=1 Tax=Altererythrobacter sp. MF3-039 TaxID=3252901 RepID=UPI00390C50BC